MEVPDNLSEMDDLALMAAVQAGRREAFALLIGRHQTKLVNFFRRQGAYHDAEDLTQETLLRLFRYRHKYRPTAKFTTFLYTLAWHAWVDHLRRMQKRERIAARGAAEQRDCDERAQDQARLRLDAQTALAQLSEKLRSVVVLSLYQGLRYEDIAAVLDVPVGTVKSRMFMAMSKMKEYFEREK
ncbi:MAG: RNA polymerase sigma factor [Kiritimatiellaeota bacterium]|nr:RNA polymerase sigma factor [Kiritimatiellota bacterium]